MAWSQCWYKKRIWQQTTKAVYEKKLLKNKRKSYSDKATGFHNKEMPKAGFDYTCLAVIKVVSALKKMKTFLCKCF